MILHSHLRWVILKLVYIKYIKNLTLHFLYQFHIDKTKDPLNFYTSWLPRESDHLMHPIHLLEYSHSQFHPAVPLKIPIRHPKILRFLMFLIHVRHLNTSHTLPLQKLLNP